MEPDSWLLPRVGQPGAMNTHVHLSSPSQRLTQESMYT